MCTQAATEWGNICLVMADLNLASSTTNNPSLTNRVSHCAAKKSSVRAQNKIEIDYDTAINQPSERIQRQHM